MGLNDAEANTGLFLDLLLKLPGEVFIRLVGNNGQSVDIRPVYPFTVLIYRDTQSTPNLLSLGHNRLRLGQGADLKDIWIVPALTQRRVGKYELELRVKT